MHSPYSESSENSSVSSKSNKSVVRWFTGGSEGVESVELAADEFGDVAFCVL